MNASPEKMQGAILIMVLWMITLGLILVTVIAGNIRLSATTVVHHQQALQDWANIMTAVNQAKMELLIDKMPKLKDVKETAAYDKQSNENPFDGRSLTMRYPAPEGITVRIYNNSGKINLTRISASMMRKLLEKELGEGDEEIASLVDAWLDWVDKDELKRLNGAEKSHYKKQGIGYEPRNGQLLTVDELRLIKGFDEVFKGVDLEQVFTVYGTSFSVNPNYASREVLSILPGMDDKMATEIIKTRQKQPFKNFNDLNVILTPATSVKVKPLFNFAQSSHYTIAVYPSYLEEDDSSEQTIYAYQEVVQVVSYQQQPEVLKVMPYGKIVLGAKAHEPETE